MNKVLAIKLTTLAATLLSTLAGGHALADDSYPKNPILRPITLNDGDLEVLGALGYGKKVRGDNSTFIVPSVRYGITDNLTVGLGEITYRFFADDDLQLAVSAGGRGSFDSREFGDSIGYGASIGGKKVMNDNLAFTFGVNYTYWNEDVVKDRSELDYSLGVMFNIATDWTLGAHYTLRDLRDFNQSTANELGLNLNYAFSENVDLGLFVGHSDFDERENGKVLHNSFENSSGIFAKWRW